MGYGALSRVDRNVSDSKGHVAGHERSNGLARAGAAECFEYTTGPTTPNARMCYLQPNTVR